MATLYVEHVPDELYEALRERAKLQHRSIAQETIALLEHTVPTAHGVARRKAFLKKALKLQSTHATAGAYLSAEEMVREDRAR
jgi:plasmid stability protein